MFSPRSVSALLATAVFWTVATVHAPAFATDRGQRQSSNPRPIAAPAGRDVGTVFGDRLRPEELSAISGLGGNAANPELEQRFGIRLWDEWSRRQGSQAPRPALESGQIYLNGQRVR